MGNSPKIESRFAKYKNISTIELIKAIQKYQIETKECKNMILEFEYRTRKDVEKILNNVFSGGTSLSKQHYVSITTVEYFTNRLYDNLFKKIKKFDLGKSKEQVLLFLIELVKIDYYQKKRLEIHKDLKLTNIEKTHVIKRDEGWAIKREGATKATKVYDTKEKAVRDAIQVVKKGGDLIIHKGDGSIQEWKTYKRK